MFRFFQTFNTITQSSRANRIVGNIKIFYVIGFNFIIKTESNRLQTRIRHIHILRINTAAEVLNRFCILSIIGTIHSKGRVNTGYKLQWTADVRRIILSDWHSLPSTRFGTRVLLINPPAIKAFKHRKQCVFPNFFFLKRWA